MGNFVFSFRVYIYLEAIGEGYLKSDTFQLGACTEQEKTFFSAILPKNFDRDVLEELGFKTTRRGRELRSNEISYRHKIDGIMDCETLAESYSNFNRFLVREVERYSKEGVYLILLHAEHAVYLMKDLWSLRRSKKLESIFDVVVGIGILEDQIRWNLLNNLNGKILRIGVDVAHQIVCGGRAQVESEESDGKSSVLMRAGERLHSKGSEILNSSFRSFKVEEDMELFERSFSHIRQYKDMRRKISVRLFEDKEPLSKDGIFNVFPNGLTRSEIPESCVYSPDIVAEKFTELLVFSGIKEEKLHAMFEGLGSNRLFSELKRELISDIPTPTPPVMSTLESCIALTIEYLVSESSRHRARSSSLESSSSLSRRRRRTPPPPPPSFRERSRSPVQVSKLETPEFSRLGDFLAR